MEGMAEGVLGKDILEQLITEDVGTIADSFQKMFISCVENVKKPNVLIAGITGSGKSTLINSIFGSRLADVSDSVPVTQHYARFAPEDKPVVIYDSKGLEHGLHEEFIVATKKFVTESRAKPDLSDHVHVVWYVVNAASGRFEPFEASLIRDVFAPIPVLIVLNKADVASAEQLRQLITLLEQQQFTNCKGVFICVSQRRNFSQSWCPKCHSDDVTFRKSANELLCENCGTIHQLSHRLGLAQLVQCTAQYLPDLAKEAFLNAQVASLAEKDIHARQLVKLFCQDIAMDISGNAVGRIGEMVARIFVLWGYNFLGNRVSNALVAEMSKEYKLQDLPIRMAMIAADTLLKRKLSRSVIACVGIMVNKPLRHLSAQLLQLIEKQGAFDPKSIQFENLDSETFLDRFMKTAFERDLNAAIDLYWI